MTILGSQLSNIGETGQIPKFVYLNTNSTVAQVTTTGYLNHFIAQGNQIAETDMVLISTKTTPEARDSEVIMCALTIGVGGAKLTQYGSTSAGFSPATNYTSFSLAGPITGAWQHVGEFNVQAGTGSVTLQSDTGAINILAPNPGQPIDILASTINISGNDQVAISSATQVFINSGGPLALTSSAGDIDLDAAGDLLFTGLDTAVTSDALYYDVGTGKVTYGAAGGGGGGFTWTSVAGTSQALVAANGYVSQNAALTTFTLPATAAVGDEFQIEGNGAGGWSVAQNALQSIRVGLTVSTVGLTGSVSSSNQYDGIRLICVTADTDFKAEFSGSYNVI